MLCCFSGRWGHDGGESSQPLDYSSGWTQIEFRETVKDTHSFNDAGDGTLVIPDTGYYLIDAQIQGQTNTGVNSRILVDGTAVRQGHMSGPDQSSATSHIVRCLTAGSVITVEGIPGSTGTVARSYGNMLIQRVPLPFIAANQPNADTAAGDNVAWYDISDLGSWLATDGDDFITTPSTGEYAISVTTNAQVTYSGVDLLINGATYPGADPQATRMYGSAYGRHSPLFTVLSLTVGDTVSVGVLSDWLNDDALEEPRVAIWKLPSSTPACVLRNSTGINIGQQNYKLMTFDTEQIDTDGFHSTSSNTGRITVPTGLDGTYLVWAGDNLGGFVARGAILAKNGTTFWSGSGGVSTSTVQSLMPIGIIDLAAGDYVEYSVYNNYNTARSASNLRFGAIMLDGFDFVNQSCPSGAEISFVPQICRRC